jgi:hypothetical protein
MDNHIVTGDMLLAPGKPVGLYAQGRRPQVLAIGDDPSNKNHVSLRTRANRSVCSDGSALFTHRRRARKSQKIVD